MKKKRRCIHDILAEICEVANKEEEVGGAEIFYQVRLSGRMYRELVEYGVSIGLLQRAEQRKFSLTRKGQKYLNLYEKISKLLEK